MTFWRVFYRRSEWSREYEIEDPAPDERGLSECASVSTLDELAEFLPGVYVVRDPDGFEMTVTLPPGGETVEVSLK